MQIGMIGLGRMGGNMVRRLMRDGHRCVVFDRNAETVARLNEEGADGAGDLDSFLAKLEKPKTVWIMLPAGAITEETVNTLLTKLEPGDTIIDGGNSYFKDDVRRGKLAVEKGIDYVDVGTSGGIWGIDRGYCLMIGGKKEVFERIEPIFRTLAPGSAGVAQTPGRTETTAEHGYIHAGPTGAGHFVKMVHNGIEYGLMQAYSEGFEILETVGSSPEIPEEHRFELNIPEIAEVWRRGSVVGSWLLDLASIALAKNPTLSDFSGFVQDSGEGRWTIQAAVEQAVAAPVLSASLYARFRSRQEHTFAEKMLSAMRFGFGGHLEQAGKTVKKV